MFHLDTVFMLFYIVTMHGEFTCPVSRLMIISLFFFSEINEYIMRQSMINNGSGLKVKAIV